MKSFVYLILSMLVFMISCKKEQQVTFNIIPIVGQNSSLNLAIDKTINDSTLVLRWGKFTGKNFKGYQLSRSARIFKNGTFTYVTEQLKSLNNVDSVTYFEKNVPYTNDVQYSIAAWSDSLKNYAYGSLMYHRPNTYLQASFSDILIDKLEKVVYLINRDSGRVSSFNYATGTKLKSTLLSVSLGYSALGSYGGGTNNELYIPTSDGWLDILDAASLTLKDRIFVGGGLIGSVVAANGKLYISSSDQAYSLMIYDNSIKIYDRNTKQVISRTGTWNNTRLLILEKSQYNLIDVTFNLIPTDLNYYKIDSNGMPISKSGDSYHGDYPLDGNILQSFPDGNRFITSSTGTVYTKDLKFEKSLTNTYSGKYDDFAFNDTGSIIYCAYKSDKKIDIVTYPGAVVQQTLITKLYPVKIFRDGNQLICLSSEISNYSSTPPVFFIEKFNL